MMYEFQEFLTVNVESEKLWASKAKSEPRERKRQGKTDGPNLKVGGRGPQQDRSRGRRGRLRHG